MTITTGTPRTIRANIDQATISRVPFFFDAGLDDILNELLQNSRRSGASKVWITTHHDQITVHDHGQGIADPDTLLSFGRSDWNQPRIQAERPAGMGLYALSRRNAVLVRSRPSTGEPWQVKLNPMHFNGSAAATIRPLETAEDPQTTGASIAFDWENANENPEVAGAIKNAARYFPLPVTYNGETLEQLDFLMDAKHVSEWRGLRIGVFRTQYVYRGPTVNFHGLLVSNPGNMPYVTTLDPYTSYTIRVDVQHCPDLELTLPARKELVQNPFLDELKIAGRRAIYEYLAGVGHPGLPYAEQQDAKALGIDLVDAPPQVRPWSPRNAHSDWNPKIVPVPDNALLVELSAERPQEHNFYRAAQLAGIDDRLFAANRTQLAGYPWYDCIPTVTDIEVRAHFGDQEVTLPPEHSNLPSDTPDRITVTASITDLDWSLQTIELETDAALPDEEFESLYCVWPLVTEDTAITTAKLAEMIVGAYFSPSEDFDDDSLDTQKEHAYENAEGAATRRLHSAEAAMHREILHALRHTEAHRLPVGGSIIIPIDENRQMVISIERPDDRTPG